MVPPRCVLYRNWTRGFVVSIRYSLDLIERHGIVPTIVEASRASGLVAGHLLGDFELAAVLQVRGDASGRKTVAAHLRPDAWRRPRAAESSCRRWPAARERGRSACRGEE